MTIKAHYAKCNLKSFKDADAIRQYRLSLLPDQFTPTQAAEVWKISITKVNTQTAKMRQWKLITSNEGKKGRIFTKVNPE